MANPEHLAALEQGVTHWNLWRRARLGALLEVDLRGGVLAVASPILQEVLSNHAFWFGPDHLESDFFRDFQDANRRQQVAVAALEQAQQYSWKRTAEETLRIYSQVSAR